MKTLRVVLPAGCSPSEMIEVMTAIKDLEDKFEVVVDFEKPVGQRQDGVTLPRDTVFLDSEPPHSGPLPGTPSLFDLIDQPLPGVEEAEIASRRRVVKDSD
jgi:hypothetical protein